MSDPLGTTPLWVETAPAPAFPSLDGELTVDVAVIGAGIAGVAAARLLARDGRSVALLESRRVLEGVTGRTTAKLTSGHGLIYGHLERSFGSEGARTYAEANQAAIAHVRDTIREEGIDCDLEPRDNVVYTEDPREAPELREEAGAAARAGLPASFTTETSLPFPVAGAVRIEGQAQLHPRKYLVPLVARLADDGRVFEATRVVDVEDGDPCVVTTTAGEVRARDIVVTTHLPILDRGLLFARAHPKQHCVIAAVAPNDSALGGMFLSTEQPAHSVRVARGSNGKPLLVFVGGGARPGQGNTRERFAELETWAAERFGAADVRFRWMAQDYYSIDRVPFIGRLGWSSHHLWVATGFSGWGMTGGIVAGMILADSIAGRANPWASLYDSRRLKPLTGGPSFVARNAGVASRWTGGRLRSGGSLDEVPRGEGALVSFRGHKVAAYRGEDGRVTLCSARCTHMGCLVEWNSAERTWDCPCHGSRFATDGEVLHGPARKPLSRVED